jgi:hypothetical protein
MPWLSRAVIVSVLLLRGGKPWSLWFIYAGLFVLSTFFNVTSHIW